MVGRGKEVVGVIMVVRVGTSFGKTEEWWSRKKRDKSI